MIARSEKLVLVSVLLGLASAPTLAADDAFSLYKQQKYAAAASSFEALIRVSPNSRTCYYAALSNKASGKSMRAQQLFQYIVTNYPNSAEAPYAKQALSQYKTASSSSGGSELPASVRNAMPPEMQRLLNSAMGQRAVEQVMRDKAREIETIKMAESKGLMDQNRVNAAVQQAGAGDARAHGDKDRPFTPADIARDGSGGIDQSRFPNCWFEASMAALADLPRGQRLLSSMIQRRNNDYVVRFPRDGVEYVITAEDLLNSGIKDKALWASIIECAEVKKFPNNKGAQGESGEQSRLEVGLQCITGCKAEMIHPRNSSVQELSSFISGALKSQNPVVAGTYPAAYFDGPIIVFPLHAYTIVGFDPARNMVTLRNPHGMNSESFELDSDPKHEEFEQLDGGLCKMNLARFQKCFYSMARSFI